jgi:hypothetical protein
MVSKGCEVFLAGIGERKLIGPEITGEPIGPGGSNLGLQNVGFLETQSTENFVFLWRER